MIPDYEILKSTCNLWRNWKDIEDSWESVLFIADYFAEHADRIAQHAGPYHWNDPGDLFPAFFFINQTFCCLILIHKPLKNAIIIMNKSQP